MILIHDRQNTTRMLNNKKKETIKELNRLFNNDDLHFSIGAQRGQKLDIAGPMFWLSLAWLNWPVTGTKIITGC